MQKALTQMNVQLHQVVSDITGTTGMAIIRAIVAGERNPQVLAALRHHRSQRSEAEIAQALEGDYRTEHIFVLQQELHLYDVYQTQITACDRQIEQCLLDFDDQVDLIESPLPASKHTRHQPQGNEPAFDLRTHLYRICGIDFTQIDGLGVLTVQTILSEVGLDPSRFPTVKHFTSWLGLSPGSRITGGKVKSSRTRCVTNRAANAFRMAAQTAAYVPFCLGSVLSPSSFSIRCTQSDYRYCPQNRALILPHVDDWRAVRRPWYGLLRAAVSAASPQPSEE